MYCERLNSLDLRILLSSSSRGEILLRAFSSETLHLRIAWIDLSPPVRSELVHLVARLNSYYLGLESGASGRRVRHFTKLSSWQSLILYSLR